MYTIRKQQQQKSRKSHNKKRLIIQILVVLAVLGAIFAVLQLTHTTHFFQKQTPAQNTSDVSKGEKSSSSKSSDKSSNSNTGDSTDNTEQQTTDNEDQKSQPGGSNTSAVLVAPTGSFVSNHHPNLGGSPAPNVINSACTTTTGATCQIIFTKDGVTKSLPAQTTDVNGSTYWSWKLQDVGLTAGSWKVTAKAVLGSQVKTADDALTLEVSQ